jgi:hypothetical protein
MSLTSQIVSQPGIRFNQQSVTADYSALTLFSLGRKTTFLIAVQHIPYLVKYVSY